MSFSDSSTTSTEDVFALAVLCYHEEKRKKRKRQYWVHDIFRARLQEGQFHTLFRRLQDDERKFYKYYRMTPDKFSQLMDLVRTDFTKQNTKFRDCIGPYERLTVFLRFLATGSDFQTLSFNFRLGHSTVQEIVTTSSNIIWENLSNIFMPSPTEELLKNCEKKFESVWNFPNCVGALDGKHIEIQAPAGSGSLYFNYKKTFSIVLLALVDAEYKIISVDVGSYGKNSDGGILNDSNMGKALSNGTFGMPANKRINDDGELLPHVIVGDEAFPLKTYLMRPYPGRNLSPDKRVFNYRLSRARRVSENAFGILCHKFRIFLRKIQVQPKNVDKIVLAALCLHNFLRNDNVFLNTLDEESKDSDTPIFSNLRRVGGRPSVTAVDVREKFKNYFCFDGGTIPWQADQINQGIV